MNQEEYPVYPNIKKTLNICKFKYHVIELKLKQHVRIAVYLFSENDILIESQQYLIEGAEYSNWGSDDGYIIGLIKSKIQKGL